MNEHQASAHAPLLALLQQVVRWLSEELVNRLAEAGVDPITPAHAAVLAHLDDETTASVAELARSAGVTRQTMHHAVAQLVSEGLLVSTPAARFPRSSLIQLTAAGRQRRDIASKILRELEADVAGRLGAEALAGLRDSLARAIPR